jgi:hypothetical protein
MASNGMIALGEGIRPLLVAVAIVPPFLSALAIVIARRKKSQRSAWAAVVLASLGFLAGLLVYGPVGSAGQPPWFTILSDLEVSFGAAAILLVLWTGRVNE